MTWTQLEAVPTWVGEGFASRPQVHRVPLVAMAAADEAPAATLRHR